MHNKGVQARYDAKVLSADTSSGFVYFRSFVTVGFGRVSLEPNLHIRLVYVSAAGFRLTNVYLLLSTY